MTEIFITDLQLPVTQYVVNFFNDKDCRVISFSFLREAIAHQLFIDAVYRAWGYEQIVEIIHSTEQRLTYYIYLNPEKITISYGRAGSKINAA